MYISFTQYWQVPRPSHLNVSIASCGLRPQTPAMGGGLRPPEPPGWRAGGFITLILGSKVMERFFDLKKFIQQKSNNLDWRRRN